MALDTFYDIEWAILRSGMTIKVDGETWFEEKKKYGALKGRVAVSPGQGTTIVVQKLTVEEP